MNDETHNLLFDLNLMCHKYRAQRNQKSDVVFLALMVIVLHITTLANRNNYETLAVLAATIDRGEETA